MEKSCINCSANDDDMVLIVCQYKGETKYCCVRCLPKLIHEGVSEI